MCKCMCMYVCVCACALGMAAAVRCLLHLAARDAARPCAPRLNRAAAPPPSAPPKRAHLERLVHLAGALQPHRLERAHHVALGVLLSAGRRQLERQLRRRRLRGFEGCGVCGVCGV